MSPTQSTPPILTRKLEPREDLLWWGRPPRGILFQRADLLLVPASLLWSGFFFYVEWQVLAAGDPWYSEAYLFPFMVIGLYFIAGRFVYDAWRRGHTYYGVTNHRILIFERSNMKTIDLGQLGQMREDESADGSGSLIFGPEVSPRDSIDWKLWSGRPLTPTFERIARVAEVHALIRRAQSEVQRT